MAPQSSSPTSTPRAPSCTPRTSSPGAARIGVGVDIADESSVGELVAITVSTFGGLDVVHNNASAMNLTPADVDVLGLDLDTWDGTLRTNLRGTMLCARRPSRTCSSGVVARS